LKAYKFNTGEKFFMSEREEKLLNDMMSMEDYYLKQLTEMKNKIKKLRTHLIERTEKSKRFSIP